jgi:hypothetical protein
VFFNVVDDQIGKYFLKVFMNDGSPPGPDPGLARAPMLADVLEHGKAEPDNLFVSICRRRSRWVD